MSLSLDVDKVTAVLLVDGWHEVAEDSFGLDSYEYLWWPPGLADGKEPHVLHGGGRAGICSTGFQFKSDAGDAISGPLSAIQAVRTSIDTGD